MSDPRTEVMRYVTRLIDYGKYGIDAEALREAKRIAYNEGWDAGWMAEDGDHINPYEADDD